jgi:outer membrane protein
MRRAGLLAAALLAASPAAAGDVLTVEQAVALALQNNRRVAGATLAVDKAEEQLQAGRTRRLPTLELQANASTTLTPLRVTFPEGAFGSFPGIGPVPAAETVVEAPRAVSGYVSATVAQPLTQLYRLGLGTRLNRLARDVEKEKLRAEREAVAADVRRLYHAILQNQAALAAADEYVRVFQELERVVGEHVARETALRADGLDVRARLLSAQYDAARARNALATRREQMNHLLGRGLDHELTVVEVPEPMAAEMDLETALGQALSRRPDLAQARLAVEQAETDHRLKKSESIPDVSLAFSYTSFVNVDLLPANFTQVGLQLKWEPFDWGRKGKEKAAKYVQVQQARNASRETESAARLEVAQCFRRLQEARLLTEAAGQAREAGRERLRLTTHRHREEAALLKDLLEAQAAASDADAKWADALLTLWSARADLRKAIGEDE